ncbi:hypothetical protein [Haloplanus aerogenes]|uniref:Uncharacterized protein n=1 Tax=Haloplanus aerogenes TaxID=660522 RepID=A0A3M0CQF8_9EURY|nr:hypothetical protein [Haloplanus aerogenes]AZH26842.1 hypothetical protein DU502_16320 [Haloplanus aerogenes]RMB09066.1 hypothetical protein ATH50_3436 [Haloplanus aerogenes]
MTAKTQSPNGDTNAEQSTNELSRRRFLGNVGVVAASTAGAATGVASAQESTEWQTGRDGLAWDSDFVQNPYFAEDTLTKAKHRLKWGTDDAALTAYENDSGEKDSLGGYVPREDTENVVSIRADKVEAPDLYAFPRGEQYDADGDGETDDPVRALEATHWGTTGATNGTISVTDANVDVEYALDVSTSSVASGETVKATFTDVSVEDSVEKRHLQAVVNVNSLASGSVVELVARDGDGDEKVVKADPSGDTSNADVFAAATGNGYVVQQRLGDLATVANGDGSFDSVQEVEIRISEADASVVLTALNVEKMARWKFGSYLNNEDTDSEERVDRYTPGPGSFTVTGLDTLSSDLKTDEAVIYDLSMPMRYTLGDGSESFRWRLVEATQYAGYDRKLVQQGKAVVPTGYDLQHTGLTWHDETAVPAARYATVRTASGVEDTEFSDISDDSWTTHTGSYDSLGNTVTLASSPQAGVVRAYEAEILVTSDEVEAVQSSSGGGAVALENGGGGGGFGGVFASVMAVFTGILGFFGLRSRMG